MQTRTDIINLTKFKLDIKDLSYGQEAWRTHNSTLAIGGVSSPLDSFVVAKSSVLRMNICAENPVHRQSAKR
jgi:hypothetical protein